MAVSSTTGGLRTGVCLSTDRPQNPYNGQVIHETDTNRTLVWDNSAWVVVADPALVSFSGSAASVTGNLTGNVTGNVTGDVTGDLTGDVAASAVTIGGENVTPYTGRKNILINGSMQINQRNTAYTGGANAYEYITDRWVVRVNDDASSGWSPAWTAQQYSDHPLDSSGKCLRIDVTSGDAVSTVTDHIDQGMIWYRNECQNVNHMAGTNAPSSTISFWVKSNQVGTYTLQCRVEGSTNPDGDSNFYDTYTVNSADTWEYKVINLPAQTLSDIPNNNSGGGFTLQFQLSSSIIPSQWSGSFMTKGIWQSFNGTGFADEDQVDFFATTGNYFELTNVQWEIGDKATPFEHRSFGEELALCQRYYQRVGGSSIYHPMLGGMAFSTSSGIAPYYMPVKMRATPSVSYSGNFSTLPGSVTGITLGLYGYAGPESVPIAFNNFSSAFTTNQYYLVRAHNDANAHFDMSAEL